MKTTKQPDERLVEEGLLTADQLAQARADAARSGGTVRQAAVRLKFLDPQALAQWLSKELQIPRVELKSYLIDSKALELVPEALARKHQVVPLFKVGETLTVATADPLNLIALDELRMKTGKTIEPVVTTEEEITRALGEYYSARGRLEELVSDMSHEKPGSPQEKVLDPKRLQSMVSEAPVVKLVSLLLADAIRNRASDIHLEPDRDALRVRFRVDGILREFSSLPKHLEAAVLSRTKILASLDIAERRKPQDGRFRVNSEGHELDVRVSVMPAIDGETIVLRLLDQRGLSLRLDQIGMGPQTLARYRELLNKAWGILLVTGPTGSGKTTTLYTTLATLNAVERNVVTLEDPVEYRLTGIRQIPVNPGVNLTFANGLRSILRQDPDVIMVGEIRDRETAEIAIQSALTGHLVFSTLHTNDAATAITRLIDMGIEPFLITSSLIGVVGQRLVRTVCPDCKAPDPAQGETAVKLGFKGEGKWMRGKGCRQCGQSGYRGRIGIFELMAMGEDLQRLALAKASAAALNAQAQSAGMSPLRVEGLRKAAEGVTTVEEILRVTQEA